LHVKVLVWAKKAIISLKKGPSHGNVNSQTMEKEDRATPGSTAKLIARLIARLAVDFHQKIRSGSF